jgi:transposase
VVLVHAPHGKAGPGRPTDVKDAAWLAARLQHGLWRASFLPPVAQRELRELTRERSPCSRARGPLITRGQQRLAEANLKLAAVASDRLGGWGRAMVAALLAGHPAPQALADVAPGRRRAKRAQRAHAVAGRVTPPPRGVWTELVGQSDGLEEPLARCATPLQESSPPCEAASGLLDTMPGVARPTAELLGAEIGAARSRCPRAAPGASWAGVAPGHPERAGKRTAGKTRQGQRCVRTGWGPAAHAAARTKGTGLRAPDRRLATRRGTPRAMMAVAHASLVMADQMLQRQEPERDAGADWFDRRQPEDTARRLVKRLEHLGSHVTLQSSSTAAMSSGRQIFSRQTS